MTVFGFFIHLMEIISNLNFFERTQCISSFTIKILRSYKKDTLFIVKLLALALTSLVLNLANLVTNLVKPNLGQPSHPPDQT